MKTINDYAELVKEKHALNKTIAPVETDLTDASRGYHIGEQFINNGELFKAKTEIAQHDALVLNTNYEPADDLTTQIKNAGGGTGTDPRLDVFENNIAPVETDETDASKAYQVGDQLILNNILYDVIAAISEHDVITTTGSGANIEPADPITSEIQTLTKNVDVLIENGAVNRLPFDLNKCKALNTTGTWSNNTYALNGVSLTVNSDGTISVITESGGSTASTQFILFESVANWHNMMLSGAPSTASATTYDLAAYDTQTTGENSCRPNDVVLTNITDGHTIKVFIRVRSGQVITEPITFKPMIADADYTGGYVPYAKTNRELTEENEALTNNLSDEVETRAKLGAHQFLNYNLATLKTLNTTGTWSDNVYTLTDGTNTITVTVNNDLSITVNGTPPVNSALQFNLMDKAGAIPIGSYGLNGCPSGGTYGTYGLYANSSGSTINTDYGNGGSIDYAVSTNALKIFIIIRANVTVNNLLFKPLIRLASDPSTDFTPYAMTNRELTDLTVETIGLLTKNATYVGTVHWGLVRKNGYIKEISMNFNLDATIPNQGVLFTIPDGYRPKTAFPLVLCLAGTIKSVLWVDPTSGTVKAQGEIAGGANYLTAQATYI